MQPISRTSTEPVRKPLQPISEQSTALGGALQLLIEASTGCGTVCNQSAKLQPPLLGSQKYLSLKPFVNAF
jgi:hypothetical protein